MVWYRSVSYEYSSRYFCVTVSLTEDVFFLCVLATVLGTTIINAPTPKLDARLELVHPPVHTPQEYECWNFCHALCVVSS